MKGFIIFEDFKKLINCKKILDGNYKCVISDYSEGTFGGVINRTTEARCNSDDTYDFETGALIALMKMCGREKVTKACDELYRDDNYKNALQEMTENNEKLMEENKELKKNIDELFESDKYWKSEAGRLSFEKHRLEENVEKLKLDCEMLQHGYNDMICKSPTKREEMWENILALHKESDVIIKVKKEDINAFLHEIENKIPEITWYSGVKIFETKYTIGDIYEALKTCDAIYFRLHKANVLTYSSDEIIYAFKGLKPIDYLPPLRWDLFEKGRLAVKVDYDNYKEFCDACERELGKKPSTYLWDNVTISISKKDGNFEIFTIEHQKKTGRKIVNWEDVR